MLIVDIDQFRKHLPIAANTEFETLQGFISTAESFYIRPVLGEALYAELDAITDGTGSDKQKVLLQFVQASLANLTFFKGFDILNANFDDRGFTRFSKDQSLYRYQEDILKDQFKNDGYNAIDTFLEYIYADLETFATFKTSTFYTDQKGSFFATTKTFNDIYNIKGSRLVFLQISRFFEQVIDFELSPVLGNTLFDKVVAEIKKESDQDTDLMALVPYIRKPMAYLAIAYGIEELGLNITDKGLYFEKQTATFNSGVETALATAEQTNALKQKARINGDRYKAKLLEYLQANTDKYTDFTQIDLTSINPYRRDNTGKKTVFL